MCFYLLSRLYQNLIDVRLVKSPVYRTAPDSSWVTWYGYAHRIERLVFHCSGFNHQWVLRTYYTCFEWKVCAWCMFINQSPRNCHRQFGPVCKSRLCSQSVRFFYLWIHLQELSRMVCLSKWSGPYDVIPAPQWSKIASPKIFILA